MITVTFFEDRYRMEVTGHAMFAPTGQDIVCAAASVLAFALSEYMSRLQVAGMAEVGLLTNEGALWLDVKPSNGMAEAIVKVSFDTIRAGFDLLTDKYPDNITLAP